jgi:methylase of polypeptide subunit release factors
MEHHRLEDLGSDIVGFIYEELIPAAERHALGQFYTPPAIAELITKWAVRNAEDKVLDPGCGSGTFLVKAYKRLLELKGYREPTERAHKEILRQLYAFDINPFPLHLTALNLATRYIRAPSTEVNTIHTDFFKVEAEQKLVTPYVVKTLAGEIKREIAIPKFDVVIGNPPYTRWTEISENTKNQIIQVLGEELRRYKLRGAGGVRAAQNPGIYIHFVMHSTEFLKDNGRVGMIISNDWLQTDYGIKFANYLLDNYRIRAVLDFASRLFSIPLIATTVILLEKEKEKAKRDENWSVFVYVDKETSVDELLNIVQNGITSKLMAFVVKQNDLPRNRKWLSVLFNTIVVEKALLNSPLIVPLDELFTPIRGSFTWTIETGGAGLGADKFFYLTSEDVQKWGIQDYVYPVLVSQRYAKTFVFTKKDWEALKKAGKPCYVFLCHKPKDELPENVKGYIEWGEQTPLVRPKKGEKPKTADQSSSARERQRNIKKYFGWYDLGETVRVPLFFTYRAQYIHRFGLLDFDVSLDKDIFGLIPKVDIDQKYMKAVLAYLNSSFTRLYIETEGRSTGGGLIEFDLSKAKKLPTIDIRKLTQQQAESLAALFDKLALQARELGGADTMENINKLNPILEEIDYEVGKIIGVNEEITKATRTFTKALMERRFARIIEAKPEAVKGEEEPRLKPPKKPEKISAEDKTVQLDRFLEG